jgi:D-glycero-D-manno-heptose 1,7-bisphosphate phosphatase
LHRKESAPQYCIGSRRWPLANGAARPAVFLDRDGTVSEEVGYLNHLSRFRLLPGAADAIRRLNEAALPVIVVTNQSGVARGYFPEQLVRDVHERMKAELLEAGARLDGMYYCPHVSSDECACRKPKTGMLEQAARELGLDLKESFVVGDRQSDVELAHCAGARSVLVRTGFGEGELAWHAKHWARQPEFVAADLPEAVAWILQEVRR